jgi:hypothetical protein
MIAFKSGSLLGPACGLVVDQDVETQELETVVAEGHVLLTGIEYHVLS